ncbi:putative ubiquitin-conjugating enzyme E2 R521 [Liparis tanakae]|uniref:Putative ubiquitin-conjugating enzyme E2 R521 n=1 Tax=Liparis tanakae TaxID=230148 RepID=A0A4Z2FL90_9TELE|nr:putative ubiquitin-conjugating enzyme E2 R521 [Liparis tanakae]
MILIDLIHLKQRARVRGPSFLTSSLHWGKNWSPHWTVLIGWQGARHGKDKDPSEPVLGPSLAGLKGCGGQETQSHRGQKAFLSQGPGDTDHENQELDLQENQRPGGGDTYDLRSSQETLLETLHETLHETLQETLLETLHETLLETLHETLLETLHETLLETLLETLQETLHETLLETLLETLQETLLETLHETLLETLQETLQETLLETLQETLQETLLETLQEMIIIIIIIISIIVMLS